MRIIFLLFFLFFTVNLFSFKYVDNSKLPSEQDRYYEDDWKKMDEDFDKKLFPKKVKKKDKKNKKTGKKTTQ